MPPGVGPAGGGAAAMGGSANEPPVEGALSQAPSSALHRLSRRELENTLVDVLGIAGLAAQDLPADLLSPFDTDVTSKEASPVFVQGLETLASKVATSLVADSARLAALGGCTPAAATDAVCFESLVAKLGLRLWRRPLTEAELRPLVTTGLAFATERQDFTVGVRSALTSLLQSPSFVYRTEVGTPVAGGRKLDSYELVSKLSYRLWGSAPDALQLERAAGAELDAVALSELGQAMLADPRADQQLLTFHGQWLGFEGMRVSAELAPAMLSETRALLQRVLVEQRGAWSQLFTSTETFVDPLLAAHYGLPAPGAAAGAWVSYARPEQIGILAHGSVLSLASRNTDDTSPTIRGKYFATRLMCWSVPPPPPDVNPDNPPEADATTCKSEAYQLHRDASGSCAACHKLMDPIGFGLERLDGLGRYRTEEKANPACAISGEGELDGIGTFNGLKGLVDLALSQQGLQGCAVRHYLRFANGRFEGGEDEATLHSLTGQFLASGEDFRALQLSAIAHPTFGYRVEEP